MIQRQEALDFVTSNTSNKNLIKHMLSVEAAMRALAKYFNEDEDLWGLVGLIHDGDYEKYPDKHPGELLKFLKEKGEDEKIINAVEAHAYGFNGFQRIPESKLEWAIYTCDELTGFIIAVTLVRPEKSLASVTVENILSKWDKKDFAKGVNRQQIEMCEEKLGIKLPDFMQIVLTSMQSISKDLGL